MGGKGQWDKNSSTTLSSSAITSRFGSWVESEVGDFFYIFTVAFHTYFRLG